MQKQSFELVEYAKKKTSISTIIYKSNYAKIFFMLTVTARVLFKVWKNKDIKLVHANDGLIALFLTPLLSIKRIKTCATIHGLDVVFNVAAYQWWVRKYLSKFNFLIAVSEATLEECVKAGIPREKMHYIPNAVELPKIIKKDPAFKPWLEKKYRTNLDGKLILSSVGRPVPRKGFSWFSRNVLPHIPDAIYMVVGTKIESSGVIFLLQRLLPRALFEKLCKMLGVPLDNLWLSEQAKKNSDQIVLLGKVSYQRLLQTYLHTDLFVMPNLHIKGDFEGFGLVALEAGVFGAVCLASNVDGIPSAIQDGVNGFLIESGNSAKWIEKIRQLSQQDEIEMAKKKFRNYYQADQITWEEIGKRYLELFENHLV